MPAASIEKADGFAQVFPEHKFHIVDVLQQRHHIVGMTGDGVNDAPALKKADCGIAVSGAMDAARAAASIVLMTPGADFMGGCARYPSRGYIDSGLWGVHDTPRMGLGTVRLGLCSGLVSLE